MDTTTGSGEEIEACPSCGARLGGRAECQRAFDELSALSSTSPVRASVHNLLVDAFAMQHTEEYGRSAKSYIAHLTALCCSVDAPGDQKLYWGIGRWLNGPVRLARPADISMRGTMTVADARAIQDAADYTQVVRRWARTVWAAYADQQETARRWLQQVRDHLASAHGVRR